jgi:hypothetical protein
MTRYTKPAFTEKGLLYPKRGHLPLVVMHVDHGQVTFPIVVRNHLCRAITIELPEFRIGRIIEASFFV